MPITNTIYEQQKFWPALKMREPEIFFINAGGNYMNENQLPQDLILEDFIALPDTIPLIIRNGSLGSETFRQSHNIRKGTDLAGDYSIDYVNRAEADGIAAEIGSDVLGMFPIVLGLLEQQDLESAGILRLQQHPYLDLRGQGTLIGFIDTGIDYTKDAFQYGNGTSKIQYIWDQTIRGNAPKGFYFGAEYSKTQINSALRAENPQEVVPHKDTVGHGTFLASIAASHESGNYIGAAPDAEIIAVKLKRADPFHYEQLLVPEWQENAYTSSDFMLGVQYIINKAEELGCPVAICVAVGSNSGGHSGFNPAEEYLTKISGINGVAVVCAAGNENQGKRHTNGKLTSNGESQNVELSIGKGEENVYLSLWSGAPDLIAVSITSPTGEIVPKIPVRSGASYTANLVLERSRVTVDYYLPTRVSGDQFTRIRILHPTPGIWRITVHGEIVLNGEYHLWLPLMGFIDPDTAFLMPNPNYTIVVPASATGVITCGAYDSRNNSLYTNSSWGPTRRPMISPHFAAPGVNVGGIFPTGYGYMSGTSVSAAITAGACALMMQWGIVDGNETALTTERIKAYLIRGCARDNLMEYPNAQWGYGRLDLFNTFNFIRSL